MDVEEHAVHADGGLVALEYPRVLCAVVSLIVVWVISRVVLACLFNRVLSRLFRCARLRLVRLRHWLVPCLCLARRVLFGLVCLCRRFVSLRSPRLSLVP